MEMKMNTNNTATFEPKDARRIADLLARAEGSSFKALQLARKMAAAITKPEKAQRRARAAEDVNEHDLANIFYGRYTELLKEQDTPAGRLAAAKADSGVTDMRTATPPPDLEVVVSNVSFRAKEKLSAKPRIYFWNETKGKTSVVDMFMQRYTPKQVFTPHLDTVLRPLGMRLAEKGTASGERFGRTTYVKVRWSQFAGCSCPCSPGFVIDNPDYEYDIHVHYEVVKQDAAKRRA